MTRLLREGRSWSGGERDRFFLNVGDGTFADVSEVCGAGLPDDARAAALLDWDGDNDPDLVVSYRTAPRVRLFRNDGGDRSRFVSLRLEGNGTTVNRDAIGARVEVHTNAPGGRRLVKELRAGEGFMAQSAKRLLFGIGSASAVDRVVVRWPGGATETFGGIVPGGRYTLVQGAGTARPDPFRGSGAAGAGPLPSAPQAIRAASTALRYADRISFPDLPWTDDDGRARAWRPAAGRMAVVTLWSETCGACKAEIAEWTTGRARLDAAACDVLALCVDRLASADPPPSGGAAAAMGRAGGAAFPYATGWAVPQTLDHVTTFLPGSWGPLKTPTTVVLDAEGAVAAVFQGHATLDEILAAAAPLTGTAAQRLERTVPGGGRLPDHPRFHAWVEARFRDRRAMLVRQLLNGGRSAEALNHARVLAERWPRDPVAQTLLANVLIVRGQLDLAESVVTACLASHPGNADALAMLGHVRLAQGRDDDAVVGFSKAIAVSPEHATALNGLGVAATRKNDLAGAERSFIAAAASDPAYSEARLNLAEVRVRRGDAAGACRVLAALLDDAPGHFAAARRLAWIRAAHPDPAVRDAAAAVRLATMCAQLAGPGDRAAALAVLAASLAESGDLAGAKGRMAEAAALATPDELQRIRPFADTIASGAPVRDPALAGASATAR